jgi:pimeloyl-ACP methyl ester carboxylesterase
MQKHLVAISGGRKMNLVCAGRGKPTVVFESGLGTNLLTWQKVVDQVARITRTCFYDRAGYGYSDPPGRPSTAANSAQDLHSLLIRARVRRPVILVGHSLGGLYATFYADKYYGDVAGLVLIDPAFAEQDKDEDPAQRAQDKTAFEANVALLRACAALARSGKLTSEKHEECFAFAPNRTPEEKSFLTYQYTRPHRYEAMASEAESLHSDDGRSDLDSRQENAAKRSFGNKPLIVLTAAESPNPNETEAQRAASSRLWRSWKAGHDKLAARSRRGRSIVVSGTGHFIQLDQPQSVIDAVKEVVEDARRGPP